MVILFEAFVIDENLVKQLTVTDFALLAEIKKYIETRLMPLKERIDKEEQMASANNPPATVIYFPSGLRFVGYSEELTVKMKSCFDEDNVKRDVELIWLKFDEKTKRILN